MQMRVHAFDPRTFTQNVIIGRGPVLRKCFPVASVNRVECMLFDVIEKSNSLFECRLMMRYAVIFTQSVHGKCIAVDLFFSLFRRTVRCYRPINATVFWVDKVLCKLLVSAICKRKVLGLFKKPVCQ